MIPACLFGVLVGITLAVFGTLIWSALAVSKLAEERAERHREDTR